MPGIYDTPNPNPNGVEFVFKTLKDNTLMFYIQPFQGYDRFCIRSHRLHRWLFIVVPLRGNIEQLHSPEYIHKYYIEEIMNDLHVISL